MKNLLINLCVLLSITTASHAQQESIPAPSDAEALNIFKTNKELHQLIKERTGYEFSKLKMVKANDWVKYWSKEGEVRKYKWTMDIISKAFDIEPPKDKDGIYSVYQVFIDYRRSKCSMNGCTLTDNYSFENFGVGPSYTFGFKKFSKEEKMKLILDYFKTNNPASMNNIVTITKLEPEENLLDNNTDAKSQNIHFKVEGKIGIFSQDYSRLIEIRDIDPARLKLFLSKKNDIWSADAIEFKDEYDRKVLYQGNPKFTEEYLMPFKNVGFNGVYLKSTKGNTPTGMYEKLETKSNEFMNLYLSKAEFLTLDQVWPFTAPPILRENRTDEEMKQKISDKIYISKDKTYIKLLINAKILDKYFSCDYNTGIVECRVTYEGEIETYKFSNGEIKKRKPTQVKEQSQFSILWRYDADTQNWFIYELETPTYQ